MESRGNCLEEANLAEYLEGELTDSERIKVEKHAARCPRCRTRLVERFEFNRERVISSLTPEDVVQKALALCGASVTPHSEPFPMRAPAPSRSRFVTFLLLLLVLAILLAYAYFEGLLGI